MRTARLAADSFIFVFLMIQRFLPMYHLQCSGMRGLGFLVPFFQRITGEKQCLFSVAFFQVLGILLPFLPLVLSRILHFSNVIPLPLGFCYS